MCVFCVSLPILNVFLQFVSEQVSFDIRFAVVTSLPLQQGYLLVYAMLQLFRWVNTSVSCCAKPKAIALVRESDDFIDNTLMVEPS